jgi:hypothetical protein
MEDPGPVGELVTMVKFWIVGFVIEPHFVD